MALLHDVHLGLHSQCQTSSFLCKGSYSYYHYCCDGVDDRGWGCGYRTMQTICSWLLNKGFVSSQTEANGVPSLLQIQSALVAMQDKPDSFKGSRQWIGSFEICLCLDYFYNVPCKIIHMNEGRDIAKHLDEIAQHFKAVGSPLMLGGETDCASKGIVGVCVGTSSLLIVDPHCADTMSDVGTLQTQGFVKWIPISELHSQSFYNLCLPKPSSSPS